MLQACLVFKHWSSLLVTVFVKEHTLRLCGLYNIWYDCQIKKENPRELNPYLRSNGTGYPEMADGTKVVGNHLLSSSVVGDGGASWRLKALKCAQEQATREGRDLEEVIYLVPFSVQVGISLTLVN
ncbi:hypothetical protein U1Q18_025714 [Sarracenia purpurea var. burkii]